MIVAPGAGAGPVLLVTVTGPDQPAVAAALMQALADISADVRDVEQVVVHGRLLLGLLVEGPGAGALAAALTGVTAPFGLSAEIRPVGVAPHAAALVAAGDGDSQLVTVLAPELGATELGAVAGAVAEAGATIKRIVQLSRYPVTSYELQVRGGQAGEVRRLVTEAAACHSLDVAVQRDGLHRRAKHLIVLDVDSTLVQGEVVDLLAERAGCQAEVAAITEAAMAGELEFGSALRERVALLAGLDTAVLADVARQLPLMPGARTLIRTLKRLGYATAVVSGGFTEIIKPITAELGIDRVAANRLGVSGKLLDGTLVGPVIDRAGKAAALVRFAAEAGVPLERTVAVGDGANDLDMLAVAGLGIAFNAKPVVRDAADTSLSVPYLDAILFLLGISREEVEAADREDAD